MLRALLSPRTSAWLSWAAMLMSLQMCTSRAPSMVSVCLHAVRALLAARSAVMRKMLFAFAEGQRRVVTVSEMQGATIKAVIEYCYTDQVEMLCQPPASASDAAALVALAVAADFFGLPALVTLCCNAVKEAVSKAAAWACVGFDAISEVADSVVSIRALANHCLEVRHLPHCSMRSTVVQESPTSAVRR